MRIDRLMKDSRTIVGIHDDNFTSKFQLNENYETSEHAFSINYNNIGVNVNIHIITRTYAHTILHESRAQYARTTY